MGLSAKAISEKVPPTQEDIDFMVLGSLRERVLISMGHRKFLGIGYDLSEEFFHSKEEEIWVSDPSQIGSEEFDFGIE
jgi:hypothetical protein